MKTRKRNIQQQQLVYMLMSHWESSPICFLKRFKFTLLHSLSLSNSKKIKGWLSGRQCNWFPHEDDPIRPQWDVVLCAGVEWECQLPRTPGIGRSRSLALINQWPISSSPCVCTDQLTESNDGKSNQRWEAGDYEDGENRSGLSRLVSVDRHIRYQQLLAFAHPFSDLAQP